MQKLDMRNSIPIWLYENVTERKKTEKKEEKGRRKKGRKNTFKIIFSKFDIYRKMVDDTMWIVENVKKEKKRKKRGNYNRLNSIVYLYKNALNLCIDAYWIMI